MDPTLAYRLCRAAQATYDDPHPFGREFGLSVEWFDHGAVGGLLAWHESEVILAFRGTVLANRDDTPALRQAMLGTLSCNMAFTQTNAHGGRVRLGFVAALDNIWVQLARRVGALTQAGRGFYLTGHSQGAALATLAGWRFHEMSTTVSAVATFGSPRVGNAAFARQYPVPLHRYENRNDPVPHLPPPPHLAKQLQPLLGEWVKEQVDYHHAGHTYFIDFDGTIKHNPNALLQGLRVARLLVDAVRRPVQIMRDHRCAAYADELRRHVNDDPRLWLGDADGAIR